MDLAKQIMASRKLLQNPYAYLDGDGGFSAVSVDNHYSINEISRSRYLFQNPYAFIDELESFSKIQLPKKLRYSLEEIEQRARDMQLEMWKERKYFGFGQSTNNPIDILDPTLALKLIGYDVEFAESLGHFQSGGKLLEVAGCFDRPSKQVRISRQFASNVQSFTAAHELGHAILHENNRMHRDRALDGSSIARTKAEYEADKFASYFLMPGRLLRAHFKQYFLTEQFSLDEATSFALGISYQDQQEQIRNIRDLSRKLASAEQFNGMQFISLAAQYRVSVEAMAIRLEELKLIDPQLG